MRKIAKILALTFFALLFAAPSVWAAAEIPCHGQQYPAKAIDVFAKSARVEVDLGFGLTYRGIIELDGTVEPAKPKPGWYGKAKNALSRKLAVKPLTLCVIHEGQGAIFYVGTENVNRYMIDKGFLSPLEFPPISTKF